MCSGVYAVAFPNSGTCHNKCLTRDNTTIARKLETKPFIFNRKPKPYREVPNPRKHFGEKKLQGTYALRSQVLRDVGSLKACLTRGPIRKPLNTKFDKIRNRGDACALSFANADIPGGRYRSGGLAQDRSCLDPKPRVVFEPACMVEIPPNYIILYRA